MDFLEINHQEFKEKTRPLTYHHARPVDVATYEVVRQESPLKTLQEDPEFAQILEGGYKLLEKRLGFYPLFLAVGRTNEDLMLTGYQDTSDSVMPIKRTALFSFKDIPSKGVFMDFHDWNASVLNMHWSGEPTERNMQSIFKPSWIKNDWITYANKFPGYVQMVVPELDLRKADIITVKSTDDKNVLLKKGFLNVFVSRLIDTNIYE